MNLLLYTEAKMKLAQRDGEPATARPDGLWDDMDITLPDSLFEELGYTGALDEEPAEAAGEERFDELIRLWAEPALVW